MKNRDEIEKAVEMIRTASEGLEESICLLRGIIGRMDAVEAVSYTHLTLPTNSLV